MALWITRITYISLTTNMQTVNQSVGGYTKYTNDFTWCNQSYTSLASSLFKHKRGYLPESQYDTKTWEVLDDFYPRALQWCSTEPAPENLVSLDISKCYPSILIDNKSPITIYTIHGIIKPFNAIFDSKDMTGVV